MANQQPFCVISGGRARLTGAYGNGIWFFLGSVEGSKRNTGEMITFDPSAHNIERLKEVFPEVKIEDKDREARAAADAMAEASAPKVRRPKFKHVFPPHQHQIDLAHHWGDKKVFGIFMDMGTGKSKVTIDRATKLWCENKIDAVVVLALKGVHSQWIDEQVPAHTHDSIPWRGQAWEGKPLAKDMKKSDELAWLSVNIDAIKFKRGKEFVDEFMAAHKGRLMMVIDESQEIKNYRAQRTKIAIELGKLAQWRVILTGTPIAKDLTDEWSQFKFLDPDIIGEKYITTFRNNYCVMGGFENRQVVGHKNLERFKRLTAPYAFRVEKDDVLDLPPKVYDSVVFEMTTAQRRLIDQIKSSHRALTENGTITVQNAIGAMLRIQQITCGYVPLDESNGASEVLKDNPRIEAMMRIVEARRGKTVIWARFNADIQQIIAALEKSGRRAVEYTGRTSTAERKEAKELFLKNDSEVDYFVGNPAAGGTGLNLQGDCRTVIYYSNSFKAIDRWQSEDRVHRMGMRETVTYFDLICKGSPDRRILANLRAKKSVSDMAIGDIQSMIRSV